MWINQVHKMCVINPHKTDGQPVIYEVNYQYQHESISILTHQNAENIEFCRD